MESIYFILVLSSLASVIQGQNKSVSMTSQPASLNASQVVATTALASSSITDDAQNYDSVQVIGSSSVTLASESVAAAIGEGKFEEAIELVAAADFESVGTALVSASSMSSAEFILQEVTSDEKVKSSKIVTQIVGGLEIVADRGDCDRVISIYKDIDGLITNDSMIGQLQEAFSGVKAIQACVDALPPTPGIPVGQDLCIKYGHCFWGCGWSQKDVRYCVHNSGNPCVPCYVCNWCCFQSPHHCIQECF